MTLLDPTTVVDDYDRDQWGRPLIVPEGGGKRVPYTRASAAAKTIEDTYNLELWARRNVAFGMARDPSLVARVLALGGDPSTWDQPTKAKANQIHTAAAEVALAHKAADIGTALHRMTEIIDRNEPLIAGPYEADIEAYVNAIAAAGYVVDARWIECRMVCDALLMAGSPDRIVTRASDGLHRIADVKTGETVDYGGLGWAAQLAAYAHGALYDPRAGERLPTPPIDRTTGLIVHLPAGKGVCTIYEIDLVAGYRAAELANEIRSVRREAKRWITPLVTGLAPVVEARERHPSGSAAIPPGAAGPSRKDIFDELGHGHDEGDPIDEGRYAKVRARHDALPDALQLWAGTIEAEARRAGVGFRLNEVRTFRRYWIYGALIMLAEDGVDDPDFVRALVARATGSDAPLFPTVTVGHAVGAMGVDEARRFADAAAELRRGALKADFGDGAAMRLVPI